MLSPARVLSCLIYASGWVRPSSLPRPWQLSGPAAQRRLSPAHLWTVSSRISYKRPVSGSTCIQQRARVRQHPRVRLPLRVRQCLCVRQRPRLESLLSDSILRTSVRPQHAWYRGRAPYSLTSQPVCQAGTVFRQSSRIWEAQRCVSEFLTDVFNNKVQIDWRLPAKADG